MVISGVLVGSCPVLFICSFGRALMLPSSVTDSLMRRISATESGHVCGLPHWSVRVAPTSTRGWSSSFCFVPLGVEAPICSQKRQLLLYMLGV